MDLADILIKVIRGIIDFFEPGLDARLAQLSEITPSPAARGVIGTIKTISAIVSLLAGTVLVVAVAKLRGLQVQPSLATELMPPESAHGPMNARWDEVLRHLDSTREAEWKFAVIEADKLVDLVLQRAGFPGETLGERLANLQPGHLETLEGLWSAHKVRNRLAHDPNFFLRYTEAKHAIERYAATLRELQAI